MNDYRLTPHSFDTGGLRNSLRFQHGFEHADLERAKGVILKGVEHVEHKTKTSFGGHADHFDIAMRYFKENPEGKAEWRKIPEYQRSHIETALKEHLGVSEPEQESPKLQ